MFWIDYWYIVLVLPTILLSMWAQFNVQSAFKKYSKVISMRRMTGAQAARRILDANGLYDIRINRVAGSLSDYYDPRTNSVNLSESVYDNPSVAAIGVASHEAGHAVQHAVGYAPVKLRMAIIPVTQLSSTLAMPLVLIGIILSFPSLAMLGCAFFGIATVFQLVTLPVEFNASKRALAAIESNGTLDREELKGAKAILAAAALTYIAGLAMSLAQLLRLLLLVGSGRRRD